MRTNNTRIFFVLRIFQYGRRVHVHKRGVYIRLGIACMRAVRLRTLGKLAPLQKISVSLCTIERIRSHRADIEYPVLDRHGPRQQLHPRYGVLCMAQVIMVG